MVGNKCVKNESYIRHVKIMVFSQICCSLKRHRVLNYNNYIMYNYNRVVRAVTHKEKSILHLLDYRTNRFQDICILIFYCTVKSEALKQFVTNGLPRLWTPDYMLVLFTLLTC